MKIKEITNDAGVYNVTLVPNWLEKIFNIKEKTVKYKDSGNSYVLGGGSIYTRQDGTRTSNGEWIAEEIDKWRRSF